MNELVTLMRDEPTTTSLKVADKFEKRHDNVLQAIERLLATDLKDEDGEPGNALKNEHVEPGNALKSKGVEPNIGAKDGEFEPKFWATTYQDVKGERRPMYKMNLAGFMILTMGFNGKEAILWKKKFVAAFLRMYKILSQRASVEWKETRLLGKQVRREETDEIQHFVEYAKAQGSTHAEKYYIHFSNLVKRALDMGKRDDADTLTLLRASEMERIVRRVLMDGMETGASYKDCFKTAKARVGAFRDIIYLT